MEERAVIIFQDYDHRIQEDLDIPLNINGEELFCALNSIYGFDVSDDIENHCLKCENPIALIKGEKPLSEYGLHNASIIRFR